MDKQRNTTQRAQQRRTFVFGLCLFVSEPSFVCWFVGVQHEAKLNLALAARWIGALWQWGQARANSMTVTKKLLAEWRTDGGVGVPSLRALKLVVVSAE